MESHLLQMRGLKQKKICQKRYRNLKSHLLQMRGLKLMDGCMMKNGINVASFTDAWIET